MTTEPVLFHKIIPYDGIKTILASRAPTDKDDPTHRFWIDASASPWTVYLYENNGWTKK